MFLIYNENFIEFMFPWNEIDTVLLDMDGTLLDLHFDHHFWRSQVPAQLSQQRQIPLDEAHTLVASSYAKVFGTLEWYCLDYWQKELNLDIYSMYHASREKIKTRHDSMPLLQALGRSNKQRILVTNAHPKSLELKMDCSEISSELDGQISSHTTGYPKEHPHFWEHLFVQFQLDPTRCLLIDDSEQILHTAKRAGVGYLLGINNPDSQREEKVYNDFPAIEDYHQLFDSL